MPQTAVSVDADPSQTATELRRQLDELAAELQVRIAERDEALVREAAIGEVLQVINSSPGNLAPVFDAMLKTAARLSGAEMGLIADCEGKVVATLAFSLEWDAMVRKITFELGHGSVTGRALLERRVVHIADLTADPEYALPEVITIGKMRTALGAPLLRETEPLGVIYLARQRVEPFSEPQIELVRTFAAQAVIAMDNARLLGELRERTRDLEEALEYQTATSDVLRVISGSVFDLEPVLITVVSTAIRLCRADEAVIYRNIDGGYRWAAGKSLAPEYERIEREVRIRPGTGTLVGRAALDGRTVHILDAWTDPLYEAKDDARIGGVRTMLGVPLMRDGQPIGVIGLARRRVEPYTEKEIELVRTFADQAVIAIENARLITETREALEQQTATAEVFQVINSSPGNLAPVFEAILEKAHSLCRIALVARFN